MMPRDGSVILCGHLDGVAVSSNACILIAPWVSLGFQPEGNVSITTLAVDTDYLIEHLYRQHLNVIPDRDAARDLAAKLYPDPVQVLPLGERTLQRLGPTLDHLVHLTEGELSPSEYFRAHALLFTVLDAIAPLVHHASVEVPPLTSRQRAARVAPPRLRAFLPVRQEAVRAAALMQSDIAHRWRLDELATHACLSSSQFSRIFTDSFGVSPIVYLSILRVQEIARLIRETDLPISVITRRVGWCHHCGFASALFRRYLGVTPIQYRRYGAPTASRDGPGIGVGRAASQGAAG